MDVMLLDDHPVVREGLRQLLSGAGDITVVAEASTLHDAVCSPSSPDVILADLILGDANGAEIPIALRESKPAARILVLSMIDNLSVVETILSAGAHGYLTKDAAAAEVVNALRVVADGGEYLEPQLGIALARRGHAANQNALSSREREVLRLIALGHTHAEIGKILSISQRTVESHRAALSTKLESRTRADLVREAIDMRIVDFR